MSKPLLLVVDNRGEKLAGWSGVAERMGNYTILRANCLDDAMDALDNHAIDVLVTDLFLSDESESSEDPSCAEGLRLIERCRMLHPRSRILAVTGIWKVATKVGAAALEAGADDFISDGWEKIDAHALLEHKLRIYLELLNVIHQ